MKNWNTGRLGAVFQPSFLYPVLGHMRPGVYSQWVPVWWDQAHPMTAKAPEPVLPPSMGLGRLGAVSGPSSSAVLGDT